MTTDWYSILSILSCFLYHGYNYKLLLQLLTDNDYKDNDYHDDADDTDDEIRQSVVHTNIAAMWRPAAAITRISFMTTGNGRP